MIPRSETMTAKMEYKPIPPSPARFKPQIIIHGGAGNITPETLPPDRYSQYRESLLTIIGKTHHYMFTPEPSTNTLPSSLSTATYAVALLEDNPLFNAGHGAVFTRDGYNELEASIMVSHPGSYPKRGVGVTGLRHIRNPILLAKAILQHGEDDLLGRHSQSPSANMLDVPNAQGHTLIHGPAAEQLAKQYNLAIVPQSYFYTQTRWDEHTRALERERQNPGKSVATYSKEEYLPQGTVGAVTLDEQGIITVATSTGGLTNKLTGRIGDTPSVGAGFWAEEWAEEGDPSGHAELRCRPGPVVVISDALKGLMADCLPSPFSYNPAFKTPKVVTTRAIAVSGTGNGDSFLRTAAARTVGAMARFGGVSSKEAVSKVAGPGGELEKSAGDRWGLTGEGAGGIIGIEIAEARDDNGMLLDARCGVLQDFNCGGMFRAWVDRRSHAHFRVWQPDGSTPAGYESEDVFGMDLRRASKRSEPIAL